MSQGWETSGSGADSGWGGAAGSGPGAAPTDDWEAGDLPPDDAGPDGAGPPGARPRRTVLMLLGGVLLVAVIGGGAWAWTLLARTNGARSPEGVAQQLLEGLEDRDPLALGGTVAPSERRDLAQVARRLLELTDELRIGEDGQDLFAALAVDAGDIRLEAEELGQDIAVVRFDGELQVDVDPDDGPPSLEEFYEDLEDALDDLGDLDLGDLEELGARHVDEAFVIVVREGGRWFLSPSLTLAEYVVQEEELAEGDFDAYTEVDLRGGADSPVGAVESLVGALSDFDLDEVIELLPPREVAVLRVYEELFEQGIREVEEEARQVGARLDVEDLELIGLDDGRVRVQALTMTAIDDTGEQGTVAVDGPCALIEDAVAEETTEFCADDIDDDLLEDSLHAGEFLAGFADGYELVTVQEDGRWYVSPMATISRALQQVLSGVSPAALVAESAPWTAPATGDLDPGIGQEGDLVDQAGYDVWDLAAADDERTIAACVDDEDLRLRAHALDGAERDETFNGLGGLVVAHIDDDLDVRLVVEARSPDDAGPYDLDSAIVTAEDDSLPVEGSGDRCDLSAFSLDVDDGDTVEITGQDVVTTFVAPDGTTTPVQPGFFSFDDDGAWTVVVVGTDGGWDVRIDEADFAVDAFGNLVLLELVEFVPEDGQTFTFSVPASGEVRLVATPDDSALDPTLELRDRVGSFVADDLGDGSRAEISTFLEAGTYEAAIIPYEQSSSGDGRLEVVLAQ